MAVVRSEGVTTNVAAAPKRERRARSAWVERPATGVRHVSVSGDSVRDIVDTWGLDSFPASDPPANW